MSGETPSPSMMYSPVGELVAWSGTKGKIAASKAVGKRVAELAKEKGIERVCFDRGGYLYHGRVKAVADGAREGGLNLNEGAEPEDMVSIRLWLDPRRILSLRKRKLRAIADIEA